MTRTVKVPREHWNIGQQIYEENLIKFGIDPHIAELAASYCKYVGTRLLLNLKGNKLLLDSFIWSDTEEGQYFWQEEHDKALKIENMWKLLTGEDHVPN